MQTWAIFLLPKPRTSAALLQPGKKVNFFSILVSFYERPLFVAISFVIVDAIFAFSPIAKYLLLKDFKSKNRLACITLANNVDRKWINAKHRN